MHFDYSIAHLDDAAAWVLAQSAQRPIIALFAPMGAGKTTLCAAIIRALGSTGLAGSPTFSIIHEHRVAGGKPLYHMDWYRLKDSAEAIDAGVEDALYSGHYCLIEWPEKAPDLLPPDCFRLSIEITGPETRRLIMLNAL